MSNWAQVNERRDENNRKTRVDKKRVDRESDNA